MTGHIPVQELGLLVSQMHDARVAAERAADRVADRIVELRDSGMTDDEIALQAFISYDMVKRVPTIPFDDLPVGTVLVGNYINGDPFRFTKLNERTPGVHRWQIGDSRFSCRGLALRAMYLRGQARVVKGAS